MRLIFLILIFPGFFLSQEEIVTRDTVGKRLNYLSDNRMQTRLDTFVDGLVRSYMQTPRNCGLSLAIQKNNEIIFYNYGEIKKGSGILPSANTVYEIGSMTNLFTASLFDNAENSKKLSYEDDVRNYLPGNYPNLEFRGDPIRIKDLLRHRSGLPNVPNNLTGGNNYDSLNPYKHYSKEMILDYLKTVQLMKAPGETFAYSALGMALAGIILEKVENKSFDELISENANGSNTRLRDDDKDARGYDEMGKETPVWHMGDWAFAGGLRSCVADMIKWTNASDSKSWFEKSTKQGNTLLWHNGGTFGFSGFIGVLVRKAKPMTQNDDGIGSVVVLSNSAMEVDYIAIALLNYLQE